MRTIAYHYNARICHGNGQARGPLLAVRASVAHRSAHVCVRRRMWHRSRQVAEAADVEFVRALQRSVPMSDKRLERHSQLERWKDCTTVVD